MRSTGTRYGKRRPGLRKLVIGAVAASSLALALAASTSVDPAEAGWAGSTGGTGCTAVNKADDWNLSFHYLNLSAAMTPAQDYVLTYVLNPTDLNTAWTPSNNEETDFLVRDLDYSNFCGIDWWNEGGSTIGVTTCSNLNPWSPGGTDCRQHEIRYDKPFIKQASTTARRALACHEAGHGLGLTHSSSTNTCMRSGALGDYTYNSTEIGWINAYY